MIYGTKPEFSTYFRYCTNIHLAVQWYKSKLLDAPLSFHKTSYSLPLCAVKGASHTRVFIVFHIFHEITHSFANNSKIHTFFRTSGTKKPAKMDYRVNSNKIDHVLIEFNTSSLN